MNQPPENPFASPGMEETYERVSREAEVVDEEVWNEEFTMHLGNIVGDSPLSLPAVCLYCAADIVDDLGTRECDQFYRLRLLEAEKPVSMKVAYSVCSTCVETAESWRRRRSSALYFILAAALSGAFFFAGMIVAAAANSVPEGMMFNFFSLCAIAGVGGFFRVAFCEAKLPKRLLLKKFVGDKMTLFGAGWKFIQRFR